MRTLLAAAVLVLAAAVAGVGAARTHPERLRQVAVPVLSDPSTPRPAGAEIEALPPCESKEKLHVAARVTAVLVASDGALWVGTFDAGLYRSRPKEPARAMGGARGRELFVNDLAEYGGRFWAATQSGLLVLAPDGRRLAALEPGRGVTALAAARGALVAGTASGLLRLAADGSARAIEVRGPDGERVRVTALAQSGGRLWIGSPSGAFSLPLEALDGGGPLEARWHPLVFGDPPAETSAVTALAPLDRGVLAGTDDGGLVHLGHDGSIRALRLADPRANEVSPGAAASLGSVAFFGTQGGGLLAAAAPGGLPRAGRPRGWSEPRISALRAGSTSFFAGTADGAVLEVRCESAAWRSLLRPGRLSQQPERVARFR